MLLADLAILDHHIYLSWQKIANVSIDHHPGSEIRQRLANDFSLSVKDAAKILGVTREALSLLVNKKMDLSLSMAFRIEKTFGIPMDPLMEMQLKHSIARLRQTDTNTPKPANP